MCPNGRTGQPDDHPHNVGMRISSFRLRRISTAVLAAAAVVVVSPLAVTPAAATAATATAITTTEATQNIAYGGSVAISGKLVRASDKAPLGGGRVYLPAGRQRCVDQRRVRRDQWRRWRDRLRRRALDLALVGAVLARQRPVRGVPFGCNRRQRRRTSGDCDSGNANEHRGQRIERR